MGKPLPAVLLDASKLFPEFVVSFLSFGFFISTLVYPLAVANDDVIRSKPLIALLITIWMLSAAAGFTRYAVDRSIKCLCANPTNHAFFNIRIWSGIVKSFLQPSRTIFLLLHGPAITLLLYLTVRLYAVDNFQTHPTNLDFGPKYGRIEIDGSYESNIAFTPEFNSFGHLLQGFLSAFFSFPAVSGWLARKIGSIGMKGIVHTGRARVILSLTTLTCSLSTMYPTYNLIKRISKNGSSFASTSFVNNCMEWTMGYVLGLALGMLLTSLMRCFLVLIYPVRYDGGLEAFMLTFDASCSPNDGSDQFSDDDKESNYVFGKLEEYASISQNSTSCTRHRFTVVTILSNLVIGIFTLSVILCGIFMGSTWNKCEESDGDDCINSTTNGVDMGSKLIIAYIMIFLAIQMVFIGIVIHMHGHFI